MSGKGRWKSRDFNIDRQPSRDAALQRLVRHYGLDRTGAEQAADDPRVSSGWVIVPGTRGDFAVRCERSQWQIRVRLGLIGPPPGR